MGIYFDSTTNEEDANFILNGIYKGEITNDFYCLKYKDDDPYNEENLVWISNEDSRQHLIHRDNHDIVIINNVNGKLTKKGVMYIQVCLHKSNKTSITL